MIGILLPVTVLRRVVAGQPTYERAELYAAAARRLGVAIALFSPDGVRLRRGTVQGYVPAAGSWQPWRGALPPVVHNRLIALTPRSRALLQALAARPDVRLYNPPVTRDKWAVWRTLASDPRLRPHLPAAWPLTAAACTGVPTRARAAGGLVAKPRLGGIGLGVVSIEPRRGRLGNRFRWIPSRRPPRLLSTAALVRRLRRLRARRRYLVQACVPLATYRGRRFDLRVPVQRDGTGAWTVPGAAVKQAWRHPFLTNLSRGGRAHPPDEVLREVFGPRAPAVWATVTALARAVAERLQRRYPLLADLGLDIGLDPAGHPWLIEVNFRDQRWSLLEAGVTDAFYRLYENPLAFGRLLLTGMRGGGP